MSILKSILSTILAVFVLSLSAQVKVPLTKKGGVYEVPCKVNGKPVNFIFDSGSSDVSISKEFFIEGVKTGLFKQSDLYSDVVNYKVASGAVVAGKLINIRKLTIGSLVLYNILGSIIDSPNTPMLLGQSALEKFGSYSIDYKTSFLTITGNKDATIDAQLEDDLKNPTKATAAKLRLNNLMIASNLEFEIVSITAHMEALIISLDVTNPTSLDYKVLKGATIVINVEILTEDGKRYTSINVPVHLDLLAGQTYMTAPSVNIRGKKAVGIRIYTQVA